MSSHHVKGRSAPNGEIEHTQSLCEHIGALYPNNEYSDVTLVVRNHYFKAHRVILAARSDYFRALLFGGMKESKQMEIEMKDTSLPAFEALLKYIYTGHMSLGNQKEEVMLEALGLAHQYGFVDLEASISDYLREILQVHNVCMIYDAARLYQLQILLDMCLNFMDKNAASVIRHETFHHLSLPAVKDLVSRDSFYAPEVEIFQALVEWVQANQSSEILDDLEVCSDGSNIAQEFDAVMSVVRLPLMSLSDLLSVVRPTKLVPPDTILDAIASRTQTRDADLRYRGCLMPEVNVAVPSLGAEVLQGEMRSALLDGDCQNYDMDRGYTRHSIDEAGDQGILIKLGTQCIVNYIKMLLWDRDTRSYSYYIEVSMDQKDWVRVIDHTAYHCRSWQHLYFDSRVALYIRIVGTNNTINKVFHVVSFEAKYSKTPVALDRGLVVPKQNVATLEMSAILIEGVSRSRSNLLNGDTKNYDWDGGYTCHQLGSGFIQVQLGQPYMLDSMRLLLWDCDDRSYSYYIEVSVNMCDWHVVVDKRRELCKSWQLLRFKRQPVVYIRIVGTHNTANEVFHCVHLECPAQVEEGTLTDSKTSETEAGNSSSVKLALHVGSSSPKRISVSGGTTGNTNGTPRSWHSEPEEKRPSRPFDDRGGPGGHGSHAGGGPGGHGSLADRGP